MSKIKTEADRLREWIERRTAEGKWLKLGFHNEGPGETDYDWHTSLPFRGIPKISNVFCTNGDSDGFFDDIFDIDVIISEDKEDIAFRVFNWGNELTLSVTDPIKDSTGRIFDATKIWETLADFGEDDLAELASKDTVDSVLLACRWHDSESDQRCRSSFGVLVFDKIKSISEARSVSVDFDSDDIFDNFEYVDAEKTEYCAYGTNFSFYTCDRDDIDEIANDLAERIVDDLSEEK